MKNETIAHKWNTKKTVYVDMNTGEIISKKLAERDYTIIQTLKKIEYGIYSNDIEYTRLCEPNRQTRLKL